jgi:hypothetical protein
MIQEDTSDPVWRDHVKISDAGVLLEKHHESIKRLAPASKKSVNCFIEIS